MARVWSDVVSKSGVGKTADTYDAIGTITIKKGAGHIYGLHVLAVPSAITAGENGRPAIQIDSKDLGISKEKFLLKQGIGDGIATNDQVRNFVPEFIPLTILSGKSLDNARIDISGSGNVTTTGGWTFVVGLIYGDVFDSVVGDFLLKGGHKPAMGGNFVHGTASATSSTSLGTISIPSSASELIALLPVVDQQDPTAGEEIAGFVELVAPQIQDFAPQKWVANGFSAPLGTPDSPPPVGLMDPIPVTYDLPRSNFDISVYATLASALTNAVDVSVAVRYR